MKNSIRKLLVNAGLATLIVFSPSSQAAPGTLPSVPLFNTNLSVEPNVFFTVDDSGSMNWELIFKQGATRYSSDQGLPIIAGSRKAYLVPDWNGSTIPSLASDPNSWIFRNFNANTLYYDSLMDYTPWEGRDSSGNYLFTDADPSFVRENPLSTANRINITQNVSGRYLPTFCTWDGDPNGNGIDESDPHTCIQIKSGNTFPSGRSYTDEMRNFANWLQYYRKREYSAKQSIGSVINQTDAARMGLAFINSLHKADLKSMTVAENKRILLDELYKDNPSGSTPLRNALKRTGDMFRGAGAILSKADGGECQQNFNVLMTDGYWNGSSPSGIGNEDGDSNTVYDGNVSNSVDNGNYGDGYSNTLADVAMYYYENDLRTDLANRVPTTTDIDLANHQHLVNYTIAFGLEGSLPLGVNATDTGFIWPKPVANELTTLDDLRHAAYNSRGLYLSASNSQVLLDSLLMAVLDITDRSTTAAAASVTSAKLTTDTIVYLAEYNTVKWQGDILAHKIKNFDTGELHPQPEWSAGNVLDSRNIVTNPRTVLTYDNTAITPAGVPFQWSNLTTPMKDDLKTSCTSATVVTINPPPGGCIQQFNKTYCPVSLSDYRDNCARDDRLRTGSRGNRKYYCYDPNAGSSTSTTTSSCASNDPDDKAIARLNYLRGDRANEGAGYDFRERATLLGDIVNSGPVYVGAPNLTIPDDAPFPTGTNAYSKFKAAKANRTGAVYAGSNDGMFHAFHESTGKELLAYIPSYLFSTDHKAGLHYLTDKAYGHMFYNDLNATIADVYLSGWKTVLMAGQRAGGRGYFALDVTDPANFREANADKIVLWEFSSNDDANLGFSYSRPQIGLMNDGNWVAIFGNGYNSDGTGEAQLFVVKINGGLDGKWTEGTDYYRISTGSGSTANVNGLATPSLADLDGDGDIDRAYAGDLNGNMWAFDLSSSTFGAGKLAYTTPLFTTEGNLPITTKPILASHPTEPLVKTGTGQNTPNLMVFFGSGQFLVNSDKTTTNLEYFYGVWDKGDSGIIRSKLVEQEYRTGFSNRVLTQKNVDYAGGSYGWNISLPDSGERAITNPAVRGNVVLFNSSVPTSGPCSSGGYGYRYAVDLATGGTPDEPVLDINKDGVIDSSDTTGTLLDVPSADRLTTLPTDNTFTEKVGYTGKDPFAISELATPNVGRFSWQELLK